jgi:hypothetical protein
VGHILCFVCAFAAGQADATLLQSFEDLQDDATLLQSLDEETLLQLQRLSQHLPQPSLEDAWSAKQELRHGPLCPQEVAELSAQRKDSSATRGLNRVLLADYPSTGSSWIHQLLKTVAELKERPSPFCSIYEEGNHSDQGFGHVHCSPSWDKTAGAALFKTHFPSQELYLNKPLASWQYDASMNFDKMVVLLRHPVSSLVSGGKRWGADMEQSSKALSCWAAWWQRAMDAAGPANVMLLRYEDLCMDVPGEVARLFHFLGGTYHNISAADVQGALEKHPHLRCLYSEMELQRQAAAVPLIRNSILPFISDWFWQHNYTTAEHSLGVNLLSSPNL